MTTLPSVRRYFLLIRGVVNMQNSKINQRDAFKILGLTGVITPEIIKQAYRKASMKYHPDRNPSGKEMMQLINSAYEAIKNFSGKAEIASSNYSQLLSQALNQIINFGLHIEICGAWVWVSGNTKLYKEQLKAAGFKWASKKQQWYYRPDDYKSKARGTWSMDQIRSKYGSQDVNQDDKPTLCHH